MEAPAPAPGERYTPIELYIRYARAHWKTTAAGIVKVALWISGVAATLLSLLNDPAILALLRNHESTLIISGVLVLLSKLGSILQAAVSADKHPTEPPSLAEPVSSPIEPVDGKNG